MGKSFDKCAVDFVALSRHCTQTLVVEGLAGSRYGLPFQNLRLGFDDFHLAAFALLIAIEGVVGWSLPFPAEDKSF